MQYQNIQANCSLPQLKFATEFMYFSGSSSGLILKLKENIKHEHKIL